MKLWWTSTRTLETKVAPGAVESEHRGPEGNTMSIHAVWRTPDLIETRGWEEVRVRWLPTVNVCVIERTVYGPENASTERVSLTFEQARAVLRGLAGQLGMKAGESDV